MLRRDPTTITLTNEDLKDLQREIDDAAVSSSIFTKSKDFDNQNVLDSSNDDSYLASKAADIKTRIIGSSVRNNN